MVSPAKSVRESQCSPQLMHLQRGWTQALHAREYNKDNHNILYLGSSGWTPGEAPLSLELFKTQLDKFMVDQVSVDSTSGGRLARVT